jgi:hypothetical protein
MVFSLRQPYGEASRRSSSALASSTDDQHQHAEDHAHRLRLLKRRERHAKHLPEPARADEAEHRRHADVDLRAV